MQRPVTLAPLCPSACRGGRSPWIRFGGRERRTPPYLSDYLRPTDFSLASRTSPLLLPRCYQRAPTQDARGESVVNRNPWFAAAVAIPGAAEFRPDRSS